MSVIQMPARQSIRLQSRPSACSKSTAGLVSPTKVREMLRDMAFVLHTTRRVADSIRADKADGKID
jgi:hypothetical protein